MTTDSQSRKQRPAHLRQKTTAEKIKDHLISLGWILSFSGSFVYWNVWDKVLRSAHGYMDLIQDFFCHCIAHFYWIYILLSVLVDLFAQIQGY
jgi:hypothetical protein